MKNEPYIPAPIDTSHVEVPADLLQLGEVLARNIHEVFAQHRFQEGWTYGPERSDRLKTNPTLVPYDQLPEIEKDYDRNTSMETIRVILSLGYKITKER